MVCGAGKTLRKPCTSHTPLKGETPLLEGAPPCAVCRVWFTHSYKLLSMPCAPLAHLFMFIAVVNARIKTIHFALLQRWPLIMKIMQCFCLGFNPKQCWRCSAALSVTLVLLDIIHRSKSCHWPSLAVATSVLAGNKGYPVALSLLQEDTPQTYWPSHQYTGREQGAENKCYRVSLGPGHTKNALAIS